MIKNLYRKLLDLFIALVMMYMFAFTLGYGVAISDIGLSYLEKRCIMPYTWRYSRCLIFLKNKY